MTDQNETPLLDRRCNAVTAKGRPCRNRTLPGLKRCRVHSKSLKARSSAQLAPAHRPDTITEERTARMEDMLKSGSLLEVACEVVGIPPATHRRWMRLGRAEDAPPEHVHYRIYTQRIEQAQAIGEDNLIRIVADSAVEDWRAAAWMLERKAPERWGRRSVNAPAGEANGQPGHPEAGSLAQLIATAKGQPIPEG